MKQAVMFGAGNIGRGFIGALLGQAGWHVTFADVAEPIIEAMKEQKCYTVHVMDQNSCEFTISDIDAVYSNKNEEVVPALAACDLITTAVGAVIIPRIAPTIAEGIKARKAAGNEDILNIVCCENGIRVTSLLKENVMPLLNEEEAAYAEQYVGFADCAVDRIAPKPSYDNILDSAVEEYFEWDVERSAWKGELPDIPGMTFVDNLMACLERKLFTLNSGHAITAYLGNLKGYETIIDSIQDEAIGTIVHEAMKESGEGLIKEFDFDPDTHHAYVERIFRRFQNPYLQDEVKRVGREPIRKISASDRLNKPLMTAYNYGLPVDHMIFGIAAALRYDNPDDAQSAELIAKIKADGVESALEQYTGLTPEHPLFTRILDVYRALALV